ncbi:hypothetical protein V6N11_043823 [Hibiscus sabdariffa]|uniref:Uncharacterized protein n=1 Tax=Hibiscus sabdariffa TaxID=183260 RepID=A0ABR2RDD2_9ROSI
MPFTTVGTLKKYEAGCFLRDDMTLSDAQTWLQLNMGNHELHPTWGLSWQLFFASILWQIWKNRNELVFNGNTSNVDLFLQRSVIWARYYSESATIVAPMQPPISNMLHCKRPAMDSVCLSTDGVVRQARVLVQWWYILSG